MIFVKYFTNIIIYLFRNIYPSIPNSFVQSSNFFKSASFTVLLDLNNAFSISPLLIKSVIRFSSLFAFNSSYVLALLSILRSPHGIYTGLQPAYRIFLKNGDVYLYNYIYTETLFTGCILASLNIVAISEPE